MGFERAADLEQVVAALEAHARHYLMGGLLECARPCDLARTPVS